MFATDNDNILNSTSDAVLKTSDMYVFEKGQSFNVTLLTQNGTPLANQSISININSIDYTRITNSEGVASLKINLNPGNYAITTTYNGLINHNSVAIRDSYTIFVKENATNNEIQNIIDSDEKDSIIEFLGKSYNDISLTITNQPVKLISYGGTTLNGIKNKAIISISGIDVSGSEVSGLNLVGGSTGIRIANLANNVIISNNSISNCDEGIVMDNVYNSFIVNNKISNMINNGIYLKNARNVNLNNNVISGNTNGIYYDVGNKNVNITNNTITKNKEWGISLDKSGEYSNIYSNTITGNGNGISIESMATELNIKYNLIQGNEENGINFGEGYRKTSKGKDAVISDNAVLSNGHMNILAKNSIYTYVDLSGNWVGTDDRAFSSVCAKIKMPFYGLTTQQTGSGSFDILVGPSGMAGSSLPTFTVSVSFDGGKSYNVYEISNGKGTVHVTNGDGNVVIRGDVAAGSLDFALEDFVPYVEPSKPVDPEPTKPSDSSTNGTQSNDNGGSSGSADTSMGVGNTNSPLSSSNLATATSQASPSATQSADSAQGASKSSNSKSVAKAINLDDKNIKIIGIGAIILLFILVIFGYYRGDIENMIRNKKRA